jgi:hypothetical protein
LPPNHYPEQSQIKLQATFLVAGVPTDPTTVLCEIKDPGGVITTMTLAGGTVIRAALGVFYVLVTNTRAGVWTQRWEPGGALVAPAESVWITDPSEFYTR